ncbi:MAG TPA: hypothetical protein VF797_18375, partial [Noviherbaspirillum sp.]
RAAAVAGAIAVSSAIAVAASPVDRGKLALADKHWALFLPGLRILGLPSRSMLMFCFRADVGLGERVRAGSRLTMHFFRMRSHTGDAIQLVSDLHLETYPDLVPRAAPAADVLVLAGDAGSCQEGSLLKGDDFGLSQSSPR